MPCRPLISVYVFTGFLLNTQIGVGAGYCARRAAVVVSLYGDLVVVEGKEFEVGTVGSGRPVRRESD